MFLLQLPEIQILAVNLLIVWPGFKLITSESQSSHLENGG